MKFNIDDLKLRSQQIADETRPRQNTAERIGEMFFDIVVLIESVSKKINKRNFIFSFLSIVISTISLILSIFKSDDITVNGANLLGVMVGVLSFLVTLLIGFQIYKAIEVEDTIDTKMSSIEGRIYKSLQTYVEVKIDEKLKKQ
jgi:hypothetical protein